MSIGLDTYWDQFPQLKINLLKHHREIYDRITQKGVKVINADLVDSPEKGQIAAETFREEKVEIIFIFISTYALSSTVLPVAQKCGVPIVMLNLQPVKQLDYEKFNNLGDRGKMTGIWLEHCNSCSVPELANVFNRTGIDYSIVSGYLQQEEAWTEIYEWIDAAKVKFEMSNNRCGLLGHYYGGMLDVYSDLTTQAGVFGTHFELLEMCELHEIRESVTAEQVSTKVEEFRATFSVSEECEIEEIERAAKTSVALDQLVEKHKLGSLAYYYEGADGNTYENIVTSIIAGNTLLTGKNIPIAGEYEVKNVQAMKIMDLLGVGGSFSEFYLADFEDDVVFWGHDGPAHFAIAESKVGLVPLPVYHGKPGKGLSIQMTVKNGPATLLSVVESTDGKLKLLVAEAESVEGTVLNIGNTNSRYKFPISATEFMNKWSAVGPSHHCAIGIGHCASVLEKTAKLLNIEFVKIC